MNATTLPPDTARRIAQSFLPTRWFGNRYYYYYSRAKLRSDPLYPGVVDALRGTQAPLLDLGCGIGLLAHALRTNGLSMPYRGVDIDAPKIAQAHRGHRLRTSRAIELVRLHRKLHARQHGPVLARPAARRNSHRLSSA